MNGGNAVQLGAGYKDTVTGFEGIAVARCEYIDSAPRVLLTATVKEPGKEPAEFWVAETRVVQTATLSQIQGTLPGAPAVPAAPVAGSAVAG